MSAIEPWFFNSISLRYLASVKTAEVLWKHSKAGDIIKEFFNNIPMKYREGTTMEVRFSPMNPHRNRPDEPLKHEITTLRSLVMEKFDSFIEKLMLPKTIHKDLNLLSWQMLQQLLDGWESTLRRRGYENYSDYLDKKKDEMDFMIWNDIGMMDDLKMFELSVSKKETIDYRTWSILCYYCCEDYIRKLSETVDFKSSIKMYNFFSPIEIFWYYTIYGTFPTEDMFAESSDFIEFQRLHGEGMYDENNINRTVFVKSLGLSLPAAKYFWKRLTEAQKSEILADDTLFWCFNPASRIHFFGQMNFKYSPRRPTRYGAPWGDLLSWPWVLFIDSWGDGCKNMNNKEFETIFRKLVAKRRLDHDLEKIEGFKKMPIRDYLQISYHAPCEKLWTICQEKFPPVDELLLEIASIVLTSDDITLCRIVMKGSTSAWRTMWFVYLENFLMEYPYDEQIYPSRSTVESRRYKPTKEFCIKFMAEVLEDDEEREMFQTIFHKVIEAKFIQRV